MKGVGYGGKVLPEGVAETGVGGVIEVRRNARDPPATRLEMQGIAVASPAILIFLLQGGALKLVEGRYLGGDRDGLLGDLRSCQRSRSSSRCSYRWRDKGCRWGWVVFFISVRPHKRARRRGGGSRRGGLVLAGRGQWRRNRRSTAAAKHRRRGESSVRGRMR